MTATEVLEGILARDGAAVSATTTQATASSREAQLHDAVTRYADAVALAASKLRADPDDCGPGPLSWLPGIPEVVADHPSWGPYLSARGLNGWQERIVAYVGHRDDQTGQLAKYLDGLQRKGVDAERLLELAVARKPLPVDHPTAALSYRVRDLVARRTRSAPPVDDFRRTSPSTTGPALGL